MKILLIIFGCIVSCSSSLQANGDSTMVNSIFVSATVYRTGAELVHSAQAYLNQGSSWLSIEDLSNTIDLNSIRITCGQYVSIQSIEFSKQYLKPVKSLTGSDKLADSIELVRKDLARIDVMIGADNEILGLLRANKEIRGTQNGLSVSELIKMMDYYKQKSLELLNEISLLKTKQSRLSLLIENCQEEKRELEKKNAKTSGRLLLQLLCTQSGTVDFIRRSVKPIHRSRGLDVSDTPLALTMNNYPC
jgi:hypothetical protein